MLHAVFLDMELNFEHLYFSQYYSTWQRNVPRYILLFNSFVQQAYADTFLGQENR